MTLNPLCPNCTIPLFLAPAKTFSMHGCPQCGGVWLDNDSCQRLVKVAPLEMVEMAGRAHRSRQTEASYDQSKRQCPWCQESLQANFVKEASVRLDFCLSHGTWFDAFELEMVAKTAEKAINQKGGRRLPSLPKRYANVDPNDGPYDYQMDMSDGGQIISESLGVVVGVLGFLGSDDSYGDEW
jgi:Zn-finger nucleic acid-binding protein